MAIKINKKIIFVIIIFLLFFNSLIVELNIKNKILYLKRIFINHNKNNSWNNITYINIDNEFVIFEENIDFSNYSTDIKTIALYLPQYHFIKENNKWWGENFTEWTNVKKAKPLYEGHHQPRKPGDEKGYLGYYLLINASTIKKQVDLARSHGIYGFGIYYYWFSGKKLLEKPLDIFLKNKEIDFPFLLIWANENWSRNWNGGNRNILIKQKYNLKDPEYFIKDIQKYIKDNRYIRINGKSVIGIYEPLKVPNIKKTLSIWRKEAQKYGIGKLYIIACLNKYNITIYKNLKILDAAYDFPPRNIMKKSHYYSYLIYYNKNFINCTNDFPLFRGSMLEWDNTARKGKRSKYFIGYSPEKFYLLNKIIIQYTKTHYNDDKRFIFVNAWNEWGEGSYLEPDEKYGYSSINALSKALFNLPYILINVKNINITKYSKIAVQINLFCDFLINDIINKTIMPLKYDFFIFTNSFERKELIEIQIKKYSNYNKYYIVMIDSNSRKINKLNKIFKIIIKKYKYIYYINNNITNKNNIGNEYLKYNSFNNLIRNKNIILDILSNFEKYKKLGFIYPEISYKISSESLVNDDRDFINNILDNIFPGKRFKIGKKYEFPPNNIFWAKIESIYQIFKVKLYEEILKTNKELRIINKIIEMVCLFLVKINGFYYKKLFTYY